MSILNTPLNINNLKLENRLVMPPMATAKSEGGYIGLIITGTKS